MRTALLAAWLAGVCACPARPPTPAAPAPDTRDFSADALWLYRVAACGDGPLPDGVDSGVITAHCADLADAVARWRRDFLAPAAPYLAALRPADLPRQVLYPFGGGDLLTALAVFPDAELIVTLSLETIDAPGQLAALSTPRLYQSLERWRLRARRLLTTGYNTTRSLEVTEQGDIPGVLAFTLLALAVHGQEPVTLRWFKIDATGLRYVTPPADGMELTFRPTGSDALRTYRHYAADLGDTALGKGSPLLAHLASLGPLAAMTKAAGFLLWRDDFSRLRDFLLVHATWMLSDASGIHADDARAAGRTVETHGTWSGPPFATGAPAREPACLEAFRGGDQTPPPFWFGYRDALGSPQLMIIRAP